MFVEIEKLEVISLRVYFININTIAENILDNCIEIDIGIEEHIK
jgi:hypothetical protein